jgi:nucleoside-diphosphate-sugar epimerase
MEWKDKKVLVNGVSGFIGSNIVKELLSKGAIVYSIDNFSYTDFYKFKDKLDFLKN